jgi:hypothetical protein
MAQAAEAPEAAAAPEAAGASTAARTIPGTEALAPETAGSLQPGAGLDEEVFDFVRDALEQPPTPATIAVALRGLDDQHLDWDAMKPSWQYQQRKWVERLIIVEQSRRGAADGAYVRGLCDLTVQLQKSIRPRRLEAWFLQQPVLAAWHTALKQVAHCASELVAPVAALAMAVRGAAEPPEWLASLGAPPPPANANASPTLAPPSSLSSTLESTTITAPAKDAAQQSRQPYQQEKSRGTKGDQASAALSSHQLAQPPAEAGAHRRELCDSAAANDESAAAPVEIVAPTTSTAMSVGGPGAASQAAPAPPALHNGAKPCAGPASLAVTALVLVQNGCAASDEDDWQTGSPPLLHPPEGSPEESQAVHFTNGAAVCDEKSPAMTMAGNDALPVGTYVRGRYLASSRGKRWNQWYDGRVSAVRRGAKGNPLYSIDYFDGDHEDGVLSKHIRLMPPPQLGSRTAEPAPDEQQAEPV